MKILLLTKSTPWCHLVQEVLRKSEHDVDIVEGERKPGHAVDVKNVPFGPPYDLIISYLCPWVLDKSVLDLAPRAINFHPAPPWHPGFAPYSWAIYGDHLDGYGITVHRMTPKVDEGGIHTFCRFGIEPNDSVYSLQQRAMVRLFTLFMQMLPSNFSFGFNDHNWSWTRKPRTKSDFEELRRLRPDMTDYEIKARIRACRYPGQPGAYFEGEEG